jgi:ParB family chromosome partitioning protein
MNKIGGLGRGLGSLIPSKLTKAATEKIDEIGGGKKVIEISIEKIQPNPHQPRKDFSHSDLEELINSIREHGIVQPLIVTEKDDGYQLIAGERRLRAAKILNLATVPAITREAKDQEKLELALVENIQRKNLNPIEEAVAYQKLIEEFNLTQEETAKRVGKSRAVVANTLRLLGLPEEVQKAIIDEKITAGHARVVASLEDPKDQLEFFKKIVRFGLNVRDTEKVAKKVLVSKHERIIGGADPLIEEKENLLRGALGTKVNIKKSGRGGEIVISFYSGEELEEIIRKIIRE